MSSFIDQRDCGPLYLSHIYLLLGCAAPVWLKYWCDPQISEKPNQKSDITEILPLFAGVLILGIGDSMVSLMTFLFFFFLF
jgi:dolichol kinase